MAYYTSISATALSPNAVATIIVKSKDKSLSELTLSDIADKIQSKTGGKQQLGVVPVVRGDTSATGRCALIPTAASAATATTSAGTVATAGSGACSAGTKGNADGERFGDSVCFRRSEELVSPAEIAEQRLEHCLFPICFSGSSRVLEHDGDPVYAQIVGVKQKVCEETLFDACNIVFPS